jgi:predicted nucleotidyltransferase
MSTPQVIKNLDKIHHPVFADVIRKYCEILLQHFGERLMGVLLYGSIARGDWNRDSDIDILVV